MNLQDIIEYIKAEVANGYDVSLTWAEARMLLAALKVSIGKS